MIKFNELKIGDYVIAEYEGKQWQGEVTRLNGDEKQICVETDVQEFWFEPDHLYPIPISDAALLSLHFTKEELANGSIKYKKASFRIVIEQANDFSTLEMWYSEDKRYHPNVHFIPQLQNQYLDMTKIHLTDEVLA